MRELRAVERTASDQNEQYRRVRRQMAVSEERFQVLFDLAPMGYLSVNDEGIIREANLSAARMLGIELKRLLRSPIRRFVAPDSQQIFREHQRQVSTGAEGRHCELWMVRPDGSRFLAQMNCRFTEIEDGDDGRCFVVMSDVSERREREERERLQTVALEAAANGIVITNPEGVILWANQALSRITGFPLEDVIGRKPSIFKSGRQDQTFYAQMWSTILAGKVWHGELVNRCKDGSLYEEEMTITPVWAPEGGLSHFIAIKQDITERLQAEAELQRGAQLLDAFFDQAPIGLLWVGPAGRVVRANEAYLKLLGCSREECIGVPVSQFYVVPQAGEAMVERLRRKETLEHVRGQLRCRDGAVRQVLISANGLWEERRLVHSCWYVRDVTPLVELEREILSISEREQLRLGQDLHDDLCQRLATAEFLCHALERELNANARPETQRAEEIGKLIRDTIDRTRGLAAGLCPIELQVEGLRSALQHLALRTTRIFGIHCQVRCAAARIDDPQKEIHLYRIAQEAVSNAVKHGRARRIDIRLTVKEHRIVLGIRNDGVGLVAVQRNPKGMGIRIMQYRAGVIGGSLLVQKTAQGGTEVVCAIGGPLPAKSKTLRKS